MKTLTFLIVSLFITGCASMGGGPKDNSEENIVVELPTAKQDSIARSPFFNTQKTVLKEKGFEYEFYYGSGGRYIVVVKPPAGVFIDFAQAEATLTVAAGEYNPEILSLSVDRKGVFMGSGDPRDGLTRFNLHVFVPASRYNSALEESIDFKIKIENRF